jgi:hypothetical protein
LIHQQANIRLPIPTVREYMQHSGYTLSLGVLALDSFLLAHE